MICLTKTPKLYHRVVAYLNHLVCFLVYLDRKRLVIGELRRAFSSLGRFCFPLGDTYQVRPCRRILVSNLAFPNRLAEPV